MAGTLMASAGALVLGVLVLWWARACRRGTLPCNGILGYRTVLTLRDRSAWDAVNRAMAPCIAIAGGGMVVAALVAFLPAVLGATETAAVLAGASVVWLILWVLIGIIPAVRAERACRREMGRM